MANPYRDFVKLLDFGISKVLDPVLGDGLLPVARAVTSENARINRRCAGALDALKASGFPCRGDLPHRAHLACSHVRYGTRLDKHAARVMDQFAKACPTSGFSGPKRRRRRR